jgi:predicted phage-related endonuclease
MKRWTYTPATQDIWKGLRKHDVTSTESAALFGLSPYLTEYELYHRKKSKAVIEIGSNDRMLWGTRLQDVVARGLAEDHGVKVRRLNQYMRIVDARMGSSFDFEIIGLVDDWSGPETELREAYRSNGVGNFEVKCVDYLVFRDQWIVNDDKSIEAPSHIETQIQHQLHVSGRDWSAIGVLVSGSQPKIIIRDRDEEIGQMIEGRVRNLFAAIRANRPPQPNFPDDADFVCKLYGYAEPGKVFDGRRDQELALLALQYSTAGARESQAKEDKDVAKAKILSRIGDAEKAIFDGFKLTAGIVGPAEISFTRNGYRNFRLTATKPKLEKQTA